MTETAPTTWLRMMVTGGSLSRFVRGCSRTIASVAILLGDSAWAVEQQQGTMHQSAREIPVVRSVDVVVIGGTCAGVAATETAARAGAKVYLVAPRPYLGEDLCATLRLEPEPGQSLETDLAKRLFGVDNKATPGHVKATLINNLIDAGVEFALASYTTDVLRDESGHACGVVIANRSGRHAVIAKIIIDATHYAWICRQAGCPSVPWPAGPVRFQRTVLIKGVKGGYESRVQMLDIPLEDLSFASLMSAEHIARDKTALDSVLRGAESLFCVPPNPIVCVRTQKDFGKGASINLDHFRPLNQRRMYVLSGCADIPRSEAAELLRPAALSRIGNEIGLVAATEAKALPAPAGVRVPTIAQTGTKQGDVKEILSAARRLQLKPLVVPSAPTVLPVLASVNVVVVGGGTAGAPAGISAARKRAQTLVVEFQEGLGGVGTVGLINHPYHGKNIGFAKEVIWPKNIEPKMEWYRTELRKAGGNAWFGVLGCGAFVDGNTVKGAVVCTPEGRGIILAKVVIDGTGNADVAIAAGAAYMYGEIENGDIALQGTGLPSRPLVGSYVNTDYLLVDESNMTDVWRSLVSEQIKNANRFDSGTLIDSRERRRVVGDHVMQYVDQLAGRTYPDSIVFSSSDYDSHGYPSDPFFGLLPHDEKSRLANHPAPGGFCFTPYRCLLPRGLEGILVIGLGISMDRDASAMVRMQLDLANQGYAAGVAAAMAVQNATSPRRVNIRALQKDLVEYGNLPASVLTQQDSFPLPAQTVQQAVDKYGKATNPGSAGKSLAVILTHRETALPLLQQAYRQSEGQAKLLYALVLGAFGEKNVVVTLTKALDDVQVLDAKIKQGGMADHAYLPTPIDSLILSLGYTGDRSAISAILRVLALLSSKETLSHHRAVALTLERLGDPAAAKPLADLLRKPEMQGYALTAFSPKGLQENRTGSIREITLARALFRCGDHQELGRKILMQYRQDLRGLFARHAADVLSRRASQ